MSHMLLDQLLAGIANVPANVRVSVLTLDSRAVADGSVFFALQGTQAHGLLYAQKAAEQGAVAIVHDDLTEPALLASVEKALTIPLVPVEGLQVKLGVYASSFFGTADAGLEIIGVTGTDGKTSVSHFIAQALQVLGKRAAIIGTLGIGEPGALKPATHTTPDVFTVHRTLSELAADGISHVAMEVSSHALDQGRVLGVPFRIAVLTNLTRDHLDYHLTLDAYAAAKTRLFVDYDVQTAVINGEDSLGRQLLNQLDDANVQLIEYKRVSVQEVASGAENHTLLQAEDAIYNHRGIVATVDWRDRRHPLSAAVLGDFNLSNLLAACACLIASGISADKALAALARVRTVPGRMEKIDIGEVSDKHDPGFLSVVDYAHTPGALESVLKAARVHCSGKLICVFGCGGDRDKGKRPLMATIAKQLADVIIVTDDNPRTEDPAKIASDIMSGFENSERVQLEHDRAAAIATAVSQAVAGDVVLVAGKGHETEQIINDQQLPFDDAEHIRNALARMSREVAA